MLTRCWPGCRARSCTTGWRRSWGSAMGRSMVRNLTGCEQRPPRAAPGVARARSDAGPIAGTAGAKIRAPHALVMVLLFKKGSLATKLHAVARLTYEHARNLAYFVVLYKSALAAARAARRAVGEKVATDPGLPASGLDALVAGGLGGYVVWGHNTRVNYQIVLYLFSRVAVGITMRLARHGYPPFASFKFDATYPWLAASVWALVMWLFETRPDVVHPSLRRSMDFLYHDSNSWAGAADFAPSPTLAAVCVYMFMAHRHRLRNVLFLGRPL